MVQPEFSSQVWEKVFALAVFLQYLFLSLLGLTGKLSSALWFGLNSLNFNSGWQWVGGAPFRYLNWVPGKVKYVATQFKRQRFGHCVTYFFSSTVLSCNYQACLEV